MAIAVPNAESQQSVAANDRGADDLREILQSRSVTVHVERVTLDSAVRAIAASANVRLQYRNGLLDAVTKPVTLHAASMSLGAALESVLSGTSLQAMAVTGDVISIKPAGYGVCSRAVANGAISGKVTDQVTQRPLRGVTILLDDASRGVTTDEAGAFRLTSIAAGSHRVTARMLGYAKQVKTVVVSDQESAAVDFTLAPSVNALDQVVVTGTVVPTEVRAVPNAITVITAKQLEARNITRIDQLFRGDIPGLFAVNVGTGSGLDLGAVQMYSRGATRLGKDDASSTSNPIKTYVDGVEISQPQFLSQIDPRSIDRIEILTGPQASTIYGSNALNGVMAIFTKRGQGSRPELRVSAQSGWVQNNFTPTLSPQHDYSGQLSGVENRLSYNSGITWTYTAPWAPSTQVQQLGGFAGARLTVPVHGQTVTVDGSMQQTGTAQRIRGVGGLQRAQDIIDGITTGNQTIAASTRRLRGQTTGATVGWAPTAWWSHEASAGQDASDITLLRDRPFLQVPSDTLLTQSYAENVKRTLRYGTTVVGTITDWLRATVTAGVDQTQTSAATSDLTRPSTNGAVLTSSATFAQDHNRGLFTQVRIGIADQLFFTYGLRAEWNPAFGADALPNYAPQYGISTARELGALTIKLRTIYGRSTRPPNISDKKAGAYTSGEMTQWWGYSPIQLANPELGPSYQQGFEGGVDLYWGDRGSLTVTRYNQTVENLIAAASPIDSVRSLFPIDPNDFLGNLYATLLGSKDSAGYGYIYQGQVVNLAGLRNQGWEVNGNLTLGRLTGTGTYSWTKSRSMGSINDRYSRYLPALIKRAPQYLPGATIPVPAHTWALGLTYAQARTSVRLNVMGVGQLQSTFDELIRQSFSALAFIKRLPNQAGNVLESSYRRYTNMNPGYATADINASQQFSERVTGIVSIQNVMNQYHRDLTVLSAVAGRQSRIGVRVRW